MMPGTSSAAPSRNEHGGERRILFFTCAAHALTHVYMVIYSAVLGQMNRDFGTDIHGYATISVFLFGMGSLPASLLGEKIGEKKLLVGFFFLSAAGGTCVGLAHGTLALALGMTLLGLGTSIFHPVGNTLIAKGIQAPGRAMGINGLWGSIGEAIGPILAGSLAAWLGSWRGSYLILTIPSVTLGLALALSKLGLEGTRRDTGAGVRGSRGAALKSAPLAMISLLLLAMMFGGFQFWIVKTALPELVGANTSSGLLPASFQSPELRGAALTSLMYLVGGVGQMLAGHVVDRRDGRGVYALIFLASIPLMLLTAILTDLPLLVAGSLMALLMFSAQPIENALLARLAPPALKSWLFGLKFTLAFGVGGLGVKLCGVVKHSGGLAATLQVAAAFTGAALVCAVLALTVKRQRTGEPEAAASKTSVKAASDP